MSGESRTNQIVQNGEFADVLLNDIKSVLTIINTTYPTFTANHQIRVAVSTLETSAIDKDAIIKNNFGPWTTLKAELDALELEIKALCWMDYATNPKIQAFSELFSGFIKAGANASNIKLFRTLLRVRPRRLEECA